MKGKCVMREAEQLMSSMPSIRRKGRQAGNCSEKTCKEHHRHVLYVCSMWASDRDERHT